MKKIFVILFAVSVLMGMSSCSDPYPYATSVEKGEADIYNGYPPNYYGNYNNNMNYWENLLQGTWTLPSGQKYAFGGNSVVVTDYNGVPLDSRTFGYHAINADQVEIYGYSFNGRNGNNTVFWFRIIGNTLCISSDYNTFSNMCNNAALRYVKQ